MQCTTIQNEKVLKMLIDNGEYYTDKKPMAENLIEPYEFAKKIYGFEHTPIFLVPSDGLATCIGATLENSIAITLDIPDEFIKEHYYYEWTDLVYFMENPEEFEEVFDTDVYPTVEDYGKEILLNPIGDGNLERQIMVEKISIDWVKAIETDTEAVFNRYEERRQNCVHTS